MLKRLTSLFVGNTIAAIGIACILNCGLGCFAVSAANVSLSRLTGLSIGTVGMLLELIVLAIATYKGEGIGLAAILNATYCSYLVDFLHLTLPTTPWLAFGLLLMPFGWMLMGKAGFGDTGGNILMNAFLKSSGKSITLIRGIIEFTYLAMGFIAAHEYVTWFTLLLTFGLGKLLQVVYKWLKYDPTEIKHKFIIKRSGEKHVNTKSC